jgi:hypothetical protein
MCQDLYSSWYCRTVVRDLNDFIVSLHEAHTLVLSGIEPKGIAEMLLQDFLISLTEGFSWYDMGEEQDLSEDDLKRSFVNAHRAYLAEFAEIIKSYKERITKGKLRDLCERKTITLFETLNCGSLLFIVE